MLPDIPMSQASPQKCAVTLKKERLMPNAEFSTKHGLYLFTEISGKAVCLVCGEKIAVFKEYNLNRHYKTKHAAKYKNLTDAERARTSEALPAKLQRQQGFFTKLHISSEAATKTSFVISTKSLKTASHSQRWSSLKSAWWILQR